MSSQRAGPAGLGWPRRRDPGRHRRRLSVRRRDWQWHRGWPDANAIKRFALGLASPTFRIPGNCDVSGNGLCNGQDANAVMRSALGLASRSSASTAPTPTRRRSAPIAGMLAPASFARQRRPPPRTTQALHPEHPYELVWSELMSKSRRGSANRMSGWSSSRPAGGSKSHTYDLAYFRACNASLH